MSNPWKKDKALYEGEGYTTERFSVDEFHAAIEQRFGKPARVVTRTEKDHEIGKHCIRAIKEFVQGKIKQDDMWAVIDNRHSILAKSLENEQEKRTPH